MLRSSGYGPLGKSRMPPAPSSSSLRVIELPSATSKLNRAENAWTPRFKGSSAAASDPETIETEVKIHVIIILQIKRHYIVFFSLPYKYKYPYVRGNIRRNQYVLNNYLCSFILFHDRI